MWRITKKFSESLPLARRKNPGETLLEVLVALAILALVMVGVIAAITNAAKSNVNIENRIVALRLAEQGVEIVRNMRDTNYLRFAGNRRNKWLCLNSACGEKSIFS